MADQDMDLKTFISSTLVQIVEGVAEAQGQVAAHGSARINPAGDDANYTEPKDVAFDIAVTVKESASGGGKAGISVAMFKIGGGAEATAASEAISRIKFSIPLSLPISHRERQRQPPKWQPRVETDHTPHNRMGPGYMRA